MMRLCKKAVGIALAIALSDTAASQTEEIIVTGFRRSVEQAVFLKRDAINARESIVAEDLGKMPDLNLAEAIQRVSGTTIVRQGGEGRSISLRGLGPEFTHTTLNGMEVPASTGGLESSGGINRGRGFDFNVFSGELFHRIDVNKSSTASKEEGGIAGSVDLYTLRPLRNQGRKIILSGQMGYNDFSQEQDPRGSFIYSDTNLAKSIGWMVSATYTERNVLQDGFGTVRWDNPALGNNAFAANNTEFSDTTVNQLYYPRLPRQDSFRHSQDRTGLSAALQLKATDSLELGFNLVHSSFNSNVTSYNSAAQFRRSVQSDFGDSIDPVTGENVRQDTEWGWPHNTIQEISIANDAGVDYAVAGTFTGVGLRTQNRLQIDSTDFLQTTVEANWDIQPDLFLSAMIGSATSDFVGEFFRLNIETQIDRLATPLRDDIGTAFSYDFTANRNVAAMLYGIDVTNADNYYLMDDDQLRKFTVFRDNKTARMDLEWLIDDIATIKAGTILNDRSLDSTQSSRTHLNVNPPLSEVSAVFRYEDVGNYGGATTTDFLVINFPKMIPVYVSTLYGLERGAGIDTWEVEEQTTGAFLEYNLDTDIKGRGFRLNVGGRYVNTNVTASGWLNVTEQIVETNTFSNFLPAINLALSATEDILLRAHLAKTLTRPGLSQLVPSKVYSNANRTVSGGNSRLKPLLSNDLNLSAEWYFDAEAILALSVFIKDIQSFVSQPIIPNVPLREEDIEPVRALYPTQPGLLDPNLTWSYSSFANTTGTEMFGWELSYQQALSHLPGFLSNFGVIANYSYVEGQTDLFHQGQPVHINLPGLSTHSYNATLYYEMDNWSARVSLNNRDDYITRADFPNNNVSENTTGPTHVDLSANYQISDLFTLTFEVINLTREFERSYVTGSSGYANLVSQYNTTGTQYFFGLRASF